MATAGEPEKLAKIKNNLILDIRTEKVLDTLRVHVYLLVYYLSFSR